MELWRSHAGSELPNTRQGNADKPRKVHAEWNVSTVLLEPVTFDSWFKVDKLSLHIKKLTI